MMLSNTERNLGRFQQVSQQEAQQTKKKQKEEPSFGKKMLGKAANVFADVMTNEAFRLDRFGFLPKDIDRFWEFAVSCTGLSEVNVKELLEDQLVELIDN